MTKVELIWIHLIYISCLTSLEPKCVLILRMEQGREWRDAARLAYRGEKSRLKWGESPCQMESHLIRVKISHSKSSCVTSLLFIEWAQSTWLASHDSQNKPDWNEVKNHFCLAWLKASIIYLHVSCILLIFGQLFYFLSLLWEIIWWHECPKRRKLAFGAGLPFPHMKRHFSLKIVLQDGIKKLVEACWNEQSLV